MPQNKVFFKLLFRIISAGSFTLFFSLSFAATTIRVPADQPTIQAGIDAAVDGDTIVVADGTYTGEGNRDIDFKGKAITVESENGAETCIIDCEGSGNGFNFRSNEGSGSLLKDFAIINGSNIFGGGYGISCSSSSPTISGCTVNSNGGGILCDSSSPTITGCTVNNNGTGISCSSSSPTIAGCTVSDNNYTGIYCSSSSPTISGCTVNSNGGGIYCYSSSPTIDKCIIKDNLTTGSGGGFYFSSCISPSLTNCLISDNTSYETGGAVYSSSSSVFMTNCTISGNTANYDGGVYISGGFSVIKNTIIWKNTPNDSYINSSATVIYSDVAEFSGTGEGNIDSDPLYLASGNYHLSSDSPCIDKGTSSGAPNTDIDGTSRPQGSGYDMGAYEFFVLPPCPVCSGSDVTLTNETFPQRSCECIGITSITIGSGVTIPSGATVTFKAPIIKVLPGFHAETGAVVNMRQE